MRTIEQMVQQEINCCLSSLISTLAQGADSICATRRDGDTGKELASLCEQAFELASPVQDYEEAAIQAGWQKGPSNLFERIERMCVVERQDASSWQELCESQELDPIDSEVYEHWAVSTWLAEKLVAAGEKVDTDFAGLNVWARQTTGQQISSDGVIERIYKAMMAA